MPLSFQDSLPATTLPSVALFAQSWRRYFSDEGCAPAGWLPGGRPGRREQRAEARDILCGAFALRQPNVNLNIHPHNCLPGLPAAFSLL